MWTSGAGAGAYQSVRRRSPYRARRPALLSLWLAFVLRVVVVGSLAFAGGFLGVVATRSLGPALIGSGSGVPAIAAASAPG